nr:hypothetical protein [Tanacetum cinerariifolium]
PVQFVNSSVTGDKTSISIEPSGAFDYSAYQTDNKLTISVRPLTNEDVQRRNAEKLVYTGEKLSLNFQDIDVRSVLQLIADFTNLNLVASDTVQGGITLRLQNVPWDQALDLVLKTKGLDKRKVMIEARIVEANVDYDKALGVRWGGSAQGGNFVGGGAGTISGANATNGP